MLTRMVYITKRKDQAKSNLYADTEAAQGESIQVPQQQLIKAYNTMRHFKQPLIFCSFFVVFFCFLLNLALITYGLR